MAERPSLSRRPIPPSSSRMFRFASPGIPASRLPRRRKTWAELHEAAARAGYSPVLEVSTKSEEKVGQRLSAFNLKVHSAMGVMPLEMAFQGSKVFERGGPYTVLFGRGRSGRKTRFPPEGIGAAQGVPV